MVELETLARLITLALANMSSIIIVLYVSFELEHIYIYIYISTLVKELSAAARIMQSSSKELSTQVADRVLKCKQTDAAAVAT